MLKIFLLLFAFTLHAYGGNGSHGGVSIVCRDQRGVIKSAELLDLYEGQFLYQQEYTQSSLSVDQLMTNAKLAFETHPKYLEDLNKALKATQAKIIFIPEDQVLESSNDAFPVMRRRGCEFEQLANFLDDDDTLLISKEIYDRLDNLNKAAFYFHEAVYSMRRRDGDKDSKLSRQLVAHLFSRIVDQAVVDYIVRFTHPRSPGPLRPKGSSFTRPSEPLRKIYVHKQEELVTVTDFDVLENEIGLSLSFKPFDAAKRIYISTPNHIGKSAYLRYVDEQTIVYSYEFYEIEEASARRIWKKD